MQPPDAERSVLFLVLMVLLCGLGTASSISGSDDGNTSGLRVPEVVELPAGPGSECLSEAGAYYGSDFPPSVHANTSSPEACCRLCQASADCSIWNWCGAGEGCVYPNLLADADGKIGVNFRVCDLKARPVTISGTTPMPPETVRTGDMAGWTSGIPVASSALQDLPGYDLYAAVQMPFGPHSADFACAQSYTSKLICELPGNLTAAMDACGASAECQGFQYCFPVPGTAGNAIGRIRLKGGSLGALNISEAIYNPYCSVYVSEMPSGGSDSAPAPTPLKRRLLQDSSQPNYFYDPLIGTVTNAPAAAPIASPAAAPALSNPGISSGGAGIGGAARRPNQASVHATGSSTMASPDLPRPSLASQAPAPADSLDDLLGQAGASSNQPLNASVVTERAPPGVAANYASAGQQHDFDTLQGTSVGRGGQPQVTLNSDGYNAASGFANEGVGSSGSDDTITPADSITDVIQSSPYDRHAGTFSNKSVTPTASVLMPLDYGYPMQIFPGVTFRYGMCARGAPSAYLRVDLMSVPSLRRDNASAYAIHLWTKVPFPTNVTCNRTCVFELEENVFFNLEDSVITRGRTSYVTTDPALLQAPMPDLSRATNGPVLAMRMVPVPDLSRAANGSVLAAPMVYIPGTAVANSTTEHGLRFHILKENSTAYINELTRLYYFVSQMALGNKHCSPGFPGLQIVMDYLQSVLQVQVTEATGENFGTYATVNGVPLAFDLITAADVANAARRGFGQSCLTESNTVYEGEVLVPGNSNLVATAEDCCQACWMYGGQPGFGGQFGGAGSGRGKNATVVGWAPQPRECNTWSFCASPIGCSAGSGSGLVQRGFCELKFSGDASAHQPVSADRDASGFLSGRTTAVLPMGARNLFGTSTP